MSGHGANTPTVKELHERLTEHVIRAGIGKGGWERLVHNIERKSDARQLFVQEFLLSLLRGEWRAVDEVWNLPNATPEMWENMANLYDEEAFPEMIRLRKAQRKLKERWVSFKEELKYFIKREQRDAATNGTEEAPE